MDKPLNCWEYMLCGRGPGGSRVNELGLCSAAADERFDGIHGGLNAGRACWVAAGTEIKDGSGCIFAATYNNCRNCDFYKIVRKEEGANLCLTIFLLRILEEKIS